MCACKCAQLVVSDVSVTTLTTGWGYDVGMPISWATEPGQTVGNITEYGELDIS